MWQVTKKRPFFQFILSALKVEKVIEFMREAYRKNAKLIEVTIYTFKTLGDI